ncbi:Glycerophosphoryl diester phosphodiesterase [Pigmentiphaga humi]|uniref:Glycerophosphoryl diester phosphodiesterase n=1 Tax=Pigmentiphaga humi TaxID=2478468 RepID=A0A3P4B022_9BURK|nr:glycerophosphodiester phosphodiesterase [Pigmentiphaga humi]VCU69080.1 Glycerophosphoryl diester phosphodiesterase [Pigmentiphaga humi]
MAAGADALSRWPYPRVLAHRGGGKLAPENTLAGMREAHARRMRGVEFDVMLAADGIPVLMHDSQLGRTVPGVGSVSAFASEELARMDAGGWFGPDFLGEPVPALQEVASWLDDHGLWMNVEIKPAPGHDVDTGDIVGRLIAELYPGMAGAARLPLFSSFSATALGAARAAAPHIPRGLLVEEVPDDWAGQLEALDCVSLHCRHDALDAALALRITGAGYGLMCYTVNEPARARQLFSWGVDAICTDRYDLIGADFR